MTTGIEILQILKIGIPLLWLTGNQVFIQISSLSAGINPVIFQNHSIDKILLL